MQSAQDSFDLFLNIIPALNDENQSIREAFSDSILAVLIRTGASKFHEMKPFVKQLLDDHTKPLVVYRMLVNLARMIDKKLMDKPSVLWIINDYTPAYLTHPSLWIRHGAVNFVCRVCQTARLATDEPSILNTADLMAYVFPALKESLSKFEISVFDHPEILFACLKAPKPPLPPEPSSESTNNSEITPEISATHFVDIASCQVNFDTVVQTPHPDWHRALDSNSHPVKNNNAATSDNLKPRGSIRVSGVNLLNDCSVELKRYQDRFAMVYEDHLAKYSRCLNHKHAINSSVCSNHVRVSGDGGDEIGGGGGGGSGGKWQPKGHLVAHSNEHTESIDRIVHNSDGTYFATLSSVERCVKIWPLDATFLLSTRAGLYRSAFTYSSEMFERDRDRRVADELFCPECVCFYDKSSLAVLTHDMAFYIIDANANRNLYQISLFKRLFASCSRQQPSSLTRRSSSNNNLIAEPATTSAAATTQTSVFYLRRPPPPSLTSSLDKNRRQSNNNFKSCEFFLTSFIFIFYLFYLFIFIFSIFIVL